MASIVRPIQELNYRNLTTIRDVARSDPALASCMFSVDRQLLQKIGALAPDAVLDIAWGVGELALFVPRGNFARLLNVPPFALPMLACASAGVVSIERPATR